MTAPVSTYSIRVLVVKDKYFSLEHFDKSLINIRQNDIIISQVLSKRWRLSLFTEGGGDMVTYSDMFTFILVLIAVIEITLKITKK